MTRPENTDREVDIVLLILEVVASTTTLAPEQARDIEQAVRAKYGGLRARIAKRKQHPSPEQRAKVINDFVAKSTDIPPEQVADSNGISRRTLYRYLNRRSP